MKKCSVLNKSIKLNFVIPLKVDFFIKTTFAKASLNQVSQIVCYHWCNCAWMHQYHVIMSANMQLCKMYCSYVKCNNKLALKYKHSREDIVSKLLGFQDRTVNLSSKRSLSAHLDKTPGCTLYWSKWLRCMCWAIRNLKIQIFETFASNIQHWLSFITVVKSCSLSHISNQTLSNMIMIMMRLASKCFYLKYLASVKD